MRIDVHHHILPRVYVDAVGETALGVLGSSGRMPAWSVEGALAAMDEAEIQTAITSISAPGLASINAKLASSVARACNTHAADIVCSHPTRFGMFATVPMETMDVALAEVDHAYAELQADGICLLTNYGGRYLGDQRFHALYEELDRRRAVVFVHPTSPQHRVEVAGLSASMLEFPFDTTRTIASLVFEGVVTRFPSIRWIFSHAGGALPYLAGRIEVLAKNNPKLAECIPQGFASMLRTMYFDCALSANHVHFKTLRELLPDTQLLLGTDYPYGPENQMLGTVKALQVLGLPVSTLDALYRGNALDLFPRLRAKS